MSRWLRTRRLGALACVLGAIVVAPADAQDAPARDEEADAGVRAGATDAAPAAPTARRTVTAADFAPRESVDPASATVRIDGIAAVVGGTAPSPTTILVLRSDVERRARLAMLRGRSLAVALGPLPSAVLSASLSELLGEALIALEARRLNLEAPSEEAQREERMRLLEGAGPQARDLLRALGVSDREIGIWVERRAAVSAFLAANLEGTLDVSDMELERLFRVEPHPYQGELFEEARTRFAAWLERQRTESAVRRWVETLAQRTPHRLLARYP